MTDSQIKYFLTLAECGSFTMTAYLHYVTQPVISKQVSRLEEELGFALLKRDSNGTSLTAAGKVMQKYFKESQISLKYAILEARDAWYEENRNLHIAVMETEHSSLLYECIDQLRRECPDAAIRIDSTENPMWQFSVSDNGYDAAICYFMPNDRDSVSFRPLFKEPEYIVYHDAHKAAKLASPNLKDFADTYFFLPFSSNYAAAAQDHFRSVCQSYGFYAEPKMLLVADILMGRNLLEEGCAAAVCRKQSRLMKESGFHVLQLSNMFEVGFAKKADNKNELVTKLEQIILEQFAVDTSPDSNVLLSNPVPADSID